MSQIRAPIPSELQRIVSRCLRKRPEDRYSNANLLADDLRRLRRETESGLAQKTTWRQRMLDAWDYLTHQPPSRYRWFAVGAAALALTLYFSFSKIGVGGVFFLVIGGLLLYRHLRNRPQNVRDLLVRRISKIPEVRVITVDKQQLTVIIEQPVAQLYTRINSHVSNCNRKLYYGTPLTVCILHEIAPEQLQKLLTGPGVLYVREDVLSRAPLETQ